ncbi:hypothetical protein QEG_2974, partial [Clostridioides difficile CD127]
FYNIDGASFKALIKSSLFSRTKFILIVYVDLYMMIDFIV